MYQYISFITSKWSALVIDIHNISTIHPNNLLNIKTKLQYETFLYKLEEIQNNLYQDYVNLIYHYFSDNSQISITIRYGFKIVWLTLCRFITAFKELGYKKEYSITEVIQYFYTICIPNHNIYHYKNQFSVTVDIMHEIYLLGTLFHLQNLLGFHENNFFVNNNCIDNTTIKIYSKVHLHNLEIYSPIDKVNNILEYSAILESYPIIPENLVGEIVSTKYNIYTNPQFPIFKSGMDNRIYITSPDKLRTCICCKINNLNIGLLDLEEQRNKTPCNCIFQTVSSFEHNFYNDSCIERATIISRLLIIEHIKNKSLINNDTIGCICEEHVNVFKIKLDIFKDLLEKAKVF